MKTYRSMVAHGQTNIPLYWCGVNPSYAYAYPSTANPLGPSTANPLGVNPPSLNYTAPSHPQVNSSAGLTNTQTGGIIALYATMKPDNSKCMRHWYIM